MKDIDYYIKKAKEENKNGGKRKTKAYIFKEDGVALVNKKENNFEELKKRIHKCKNLGINITEYYDYKKIGDEYYILEELASGEEVAFLLDNDVSFASNITYEQLEKFINDEYLLDINQIGTENRYRNLFYDKEKGFTFIDVAPIDRIIDFNRLENNYKFFLLHKVILSIYSYTNTISDKIVLDIIKAFENGYPYFNKYSRWLYRAFPYFSDFLEKRGYDLTLDDKEYNELLYYINEIIEEEVKMKIDDPDKGVCETNSFYIECLAYSIHKCPKFDLFDVSTEKIKKDRKISDDDIIKEKSYAFKNYIKNSVVDKLKILFLDNIENEKIKEAYYIERKKQLNPYNFYSDESVSNYVLKEINQIIDSKVNIHK